MMKSKKRFLGVFEDSFMRNIFGGDYLFYFFKGGLIKNSFGNHVLGQVNFEIKPEFKL